jgi:alpha-mannosidase
MLLSLMEGECANPTAKSDHCFRTTFGAMMSNYWNTNFMSSQGGKFHFRYTITSAGTFRPSQLTRLGWDAMTPLEANSTGANTAAPQGLSANQDSFFAIDNPNVVMTTWKLAEDGNGSIVRLEEIAGQTEQICLQPSHLQVLQAQRCNLLEACSGETPLTGNAIHLTMKPFEILTLRLRTRPESHP